MATRRMAGIVALIVLLAAACSDGEGDAAPDLGPSSTSSTELTTTTTTPPLTGQPLIVAQQGVSSFPDPFDPTSTLGGYGVIIQNPNPDVMATGIHVTTRILDAAGTELLVDSALLNGIMPGQHMAVGRTLIEPIAEPTTVDVRLEVAAWLEPAYDEGGLVAEGVVTEPEEAGGSVTRFTVRSSWPALEEGVDVTAIYRAADGRILSAESTTIPQLSTGTSVEGRIRLLSPIPELATTEVFVGRGFAAQTVG
jgi:hypothetical protein